MSSLSSSFLSTLLPNSKTLHSSNSNPPFSSHLPTQKVSCGKMEKKPLQPPSLEPNNSSSYTPQKATPLSKHNYKPSRKGPSLPAVLLNSLDDFINTFIDPPIHPSVDPECVLSSNFAPVDELPPTECEVVKGSLPPCLDGAYIRNGPNPQYHPRGPYHLFDGDGMLHSIRISQGKATFCSRYVKTYKYMVENEAGFSVLPNIFSGFNSLTASLTRGAVSSARIFTGQFNPNNGFGTANTSLALFGGNLFALCESDLPYAIKLAPDGDIRTLGRHDFDGKLCINMTAHPKIDPETNEAFAFRYGPIPPFLTYFIIDPNGTKRPDVPIFSMTRPSFVHDFAITKNYAIFADIQMEMNPFEFINGRSLVSFDSRKVPRLGVIPRYAMDESEMKWFETPGVNILHAINAWEENDHGDTIVMIATNILLIEHFMDRMDLTHASIEKIMIDLKTGIVSIHPLSTMNLDLGVINPTYVGKKNKYVYAAIGNPFPKTAGVVKLDISISQTDRRDCIVATRLFGPNCFGSEPFFVAKNPTNLATDEDDGYVVCYVHNENTGESWFMVMDAKSNDLEIVAVVKLPQRVPYGFHGIFVKENDLNML